MRAIIQHKILHDDIIELMDLLRGHYEVIKHVENIIFCDMTRKKGCLNSSCMFFKFVPFNIIHGEDRCSFSRNNWAHADKSNYLLLAKYKLKSHERITELIEILNKKIPKEVPRYRFKDKCMFSHIDIDINKKEIIVVWKRYDAPIEMINENVHHINTKLRDNKMPFFEALKLGEI